MIAALQKLQEKFDQYNEKKRLLISIAILLVVFLLWYFVFYTPVIKAISRKKIAIIATQKKIEEDQVEITRLNKQLKSRISNDSQARQLIARLKQLVATADSINTLRAKLTKVMTHPQGIEFTELKIFPPEPWLPENARNIALPEGTKDLKQYRVEMRFNSGYLETLSYLKTLASMPWSLRWETLNYTVTTYPMAEVTVVFVLTGKESTPS